MVCTVSPRPTPEEEPDENSLDGVARLLYRFLVSLPSPERAHLTNGALGQCIGRSERRVAWALAQLDGAGLVRRSYRAPDRTDPSTVSGRVIVVCSETAWAA